MDRRIFVASGLASGLMGTQSRAFDSDGFYVPAEDVPHEKTLMQWPVSPAVYGDDWFFLGQVQDTIADIANTIAAFEPVVMLADASEHRRARRKLSDGVALWDIPTEDLWARDSGPIVAVNDRGDRIVRHIQFNGWGNKQPHRNDARIAERAAAMLGFEIRPTGLKGEAGGVEQDGHGTLIAHESSWVIANRNRGLTRTVIEDRLLRSYGADRMIWAPGVKGLDITDYHIDSLVRFTAPGRVLMNLPRTARNTDPFYRAAIQTRDAIAAAGLRITVIPEPDYPRIEDPEFVASYVNFYVCNGAVIAPQFGDRETDTAARDALSRAFPNREIVMLNTDPLGQLGGGIHCATQQIPA